LEKIRYHDLDALRAFAMLLGILLHGLLSFVPTPIWPIQDNDQSEIYFIPLMLIHGFRMSLFFFLSGFFTMMMWKKRGTFHLLRQRTIRIILPFLIFGALIFPLLNNMGAFVSSAGTTQIAEKKSAVITEYTIPNDLGGAARKGNLEKIKGLIQKGADINGRYDKGFTPLHWAATLNHVEVIEILVDRGANLNSRDNHLSTPLLLAAFFGNAESVEYLLQRGADPYLKNKDGALPVQAMMANRQITEWLAMNILEIPMEWTNVNEGRKRVKKLLISEESLAGQKQSWFAQNYFMLGQFCLHHLWFLYDLAYLSVGFIVLAWLLKFIPNFGFSKWLAESPLRLLCLIPITYLAQFYMGSGEDGVFGPATAVFLKPDWAKLAYYSIFFGHGAICFTWKGFHEKVGRLWPVYLSLAGITFVLALPLLDEKDMGWNYEWISLCSAIFVWLMIFGLIGWFRKLFSQANPKVRFISDSSYWLYIAHLPLIQIIQFWVSEWSIPSFIKLIFICTITTLLLLFSYRYLIRYTLIGTMLNGKRYKLHETN
jgi:peptidoglycan/LPS O-acetylase OafA/YrhL